MFESTQTNAWMHLLGIVSGDGKKNGTFSLCYACAFVCGKWRKHHHHIVCLCLHCVNLFFVSAILHFFFANFLQINYMAGCYIAVHGTFALLLGLLLCSSAKCSWFPFLANYNYTIITFLLGWPHRHTIQVSSMALLIFLTPTWLGLAWLGLVHGLALLFPFILYHEI